ncbi:XkdX family protein [Paenibacillus sp. JNUCC31]|nr:XkdX family protein [Paenibacillus sp. JNUCC-31]QOS77958.1 XkdX family protein [Paenibacillus sp. JNUCC-31]QOS78002.1 XkdX family protein [Paenibacillus sp. JNUCC-31]
MTFWSMAFKWKWVTAEALKGAVKTEANPFGEITPDEYEEITNVKYEV